MLECPLGLCIAGRMTRGFRTPGRSECPGGQCIAGRMDVVYDTMLPAIHRPSRALQPTCSISGDRPSYIEPFQDT